MVQSFRDLEITAEVSLRQLCGYCGDADGPAPVSQQPVGAINRRVVSDNLSAIKICNKQTKSRLPGRRAGVSPAPR
jgi:hypothetical protein